MQQIDRKAKEHSAAISKILDLARYPHHCRPTGRVKEDLVRLRLSKGDILDEIIAHLKNAALPVFYQVQTMYEKAEEMGYVFCPLRVNGIDLYVKLVIPPAESELRECLLIRAVHEPEFPCPEVHK